MGIYYDIIEDFLDSKLKSARVIYKGKTPNQIYISLLVQLKKCPKPVIICRRKEKIYLLQNPFWVPRLVELFQEVFPIKEKRCLECGAIIPYYIKRHFCNKKCYWKYNNIRCNNHLLWKRQHILGTGGKTYKVNKRSRSSFCEICGRGEKEVGRLGYHHWDDSNLNKGIWVCRKKKPDQPFGLKGVICHDMAEAIDVLQEQGAIDMDKISGLHKKYLDLKAQIEEEFFAERLGGERTTPSVKTLQSLNPSAESYKNRNL